MNYYEPLINEGFSLPYRWLLARFLYAHFNGLKLKIYMPVFSCTCMYGQKRANNNRFKAPKLTKTAN